MADRRRGCGTATGARILGMGPDVGGQATQHFGQGKHNQLYLRGQSQVQGSKNKGQLIADHREKASKQLAAASGLPYPHRAVRSRL